MAELLLHKSLYDGPSVHRVAALYGEVARVSIDDGEHELIVRFDDVDPDVADDLLDHFGNHVLVESVRTHNHAEQTLTGQDAGGAA